MSTWTETVTYIKSQLRPGVLGNTNVQKILNAVLAVVQQINGGDFSPTPDALWKADVTYAADIQPVLWQDQWLVSNVADNLGNVPISTTGLVHPSWRVIGSSAGSGIRFWQAVVYPNTLEIVFQAGQLYYLDRGVVGLDPFVSMDFSSELADAKWSNLLLDHDHHDLYFTKSEINSFLAQKEAAFGKNTAFNKNFGTTADTVAQGNDSRIDNGQTAFGWGNHANAGYAVLGTGTSQVRSNTQLDARYAAIAHTHQIIEVNGLQASLDAKANLSLKGAANGLAELDANGKVPLSQINDSIIGQVEYKGSWNPATNTPTLPTTPTEKGHYYIASVDGSRFGLDFKTGDWIISNGSTWDKVDNTDAVSSVFGRTGPITAQESDYQSFYVRLSQTYSNPSWISSLAWSKLSGVPTSFTPAAHTHAISEVSGLQTALDGKEAAFTKNSAFNKNFGTTAGTVAQGNDSRIGNGQTAYGWGNHASAGYAVLGTDSGQVRSNSQLDGRFVRFQIDLLNTTGDKDWANTVRGLAWDDQSNVSTSNYPSAFGVTFSFSNYNAPSSTARGRDWDVFKQKDFDHWWIRGYDASGNKNSWKRLWHSGNLPDPLNLTNGNAILPLNRFFGSGITATDTYMQTDSNGAINFNVAANELYRFYRNGSLLATINGAAVTSYQGFQSKSPGSVSQLGPSWRFGAKFSGSTSTDHVLRVQVGNDIFDIPAKFIQTIQDPIV
jgi:ABC-type Fe3+ transport system substrate-binding protein